MNFEKYIIDEGDFDFYMSLPDDERLLFIHDLICEGAYGNGSTGNEFKIESPILDSVEFDELIKNFESRMSSLVDASLSDDHPVNVLFINSTIVVQSNDIHELKLTLNDFIMDGYLLSKFEMTEASKKVFQRRKHCAMYQIIGKNDPISEN